MTSSNNLINKYDTLFHKLALLTVLAVYLVIVAGGIVRSTGSGMGCPDWPKCFGRWVPPTDISQLPVNYQEIYGAKLKGEVEFNALKTWIEYANRLVGAVSGLLVFGTLLTSITYLGRKPAVFYGSLLSFLLIGLNGWLGAKVVASELTPYMVTLHMLLAILVVFALLYALTQSYKGTLITNIPEINKQLLQRLLIWTILLSTIQVLLGTQVREVMDEVIQRLGYSERYRWIENLGLPFYIHRSFSLVILGLHLALLYQLRKFVNSKGLVYNFTVSILALVFIEIGTGVVLSYLGVPAIAQPIHLTLAIVMLGLQFSFLLVLINGQPLKASLPEYSVHLRS